MTEVHGYGKVGSCTDEEFKMIILSLDPDGQLEQKNSLGLELNITSSFLCHVNDVLARPILNNDVASSSRTADREKEKLKASNFPISRLIIGTYEMTSMREGDLIAKFYYAKRKLVWEILHGAIKIKMEMQWSQIEAIRATICENLPGILEIEINQPPVFSKEIDPQPRKHTLWQISSDFTGGQALICRRHRVVFPPGALDKHYEKLLQSDQHLLELSRKPFPSGNSPYFYLNHYNCNNSITSSGLYFAPSSSQGIDFEQKEEIGNSYMHAKLAKEGEIARKFYLLNDQNQALLLPATQSSVLEDNLNSSQYFQGDYFWQSPTMSSYMEPGLEYTLNFDYKNSVPNMSESLDSHSGMNWPMPVSYIPEQVSSDDVAFPKGLPHTFTGTSLGDYGVDGVASTSYLG